MYVNTRLSGTQGVSFLSFLPCAVLRGGDPSYLGRAKASCGYIRGLLYKIRAKRLTDSSDSLIDTDSVAKDGYMIADSAIVQQVPREWRWESHSQPLWAFLVHTFPKVLEALRSHSGVPLEPQQRHLTRSTRNPGTPPKTGTCQNLCVLTLQIDRYSRGSVELCVWLGCHSPQAF